MIDSLIIRNQTTGQYVTIDTANSDFVLGDVDLGTVQGTHNSYKFYDQIGAYIESTFLEQRSISIQGWVVGNTYDLLRQNKKILNALINPKETLQVVVFDAYMLEFKPDYSISYSKPYQDNNEVLCRFLIQGTCADPLFRSVLPTNLPVSTTTPKFHFPLIVPASEGILMGVKQFSPVVSVINRGEMASGVKIQLSCTSAVTNPRILLVNTGEYIKINKVLGVSETITISTLDGEKYIKGQIAGGDEQNYFQYRDWGSSWFKLRPGSNTIQYEADDNVQGLEINFTFQNRFLEVE